MTPSIAPQPAWPRLALPALAIPPLIAFNLPPSATFFNQATSLIGWALWLAAIAATLPGAPGRLDRGVAALVAALGIVALAALLGPGLTGLTPSLSLSSAGMVLAAMLTVMVAAAAAGAGRAQDAFAALCLGLVVAGGFSAVIGLIQVFAPALADGDWIAVSSLPGLAIGNLRQSNHLMTLLLWSIIATAWLADSGRLRAGLALAMAGVMMVVVVLTASRTGAVAALLLALWGIVDRRLAPRTRWALVAAPIVFLIAWWTLGVWARSSGEALMAQTKFSVANAAASSRWAIYADTLTMIRASPWLGVGFGEFNLAWSLTPLPNRPVAFFDHTHSLPLQLAVELGLPVAALVCALLVYALWRAWRRSAADTSAAPPSRAATVMVLMAMLHSLLEYPLWYAYFLLPAAFAFGLALGAPVASPRRASGPWRAGVAASLVMLVLSLLSIVDYGRVVAVFSPGDRAAPLAARIEAGKRSVLFAHHAHYAAATTAERPSEVMDSFAAASHFLLDTRLMTAWADAYAEAGDLERARHIAQRLREFRNAASKDYFAACDAPPADDVPYQCEAPKAPLGWKDFR